MTQLYSPFVEDDEQRLRRLHAERKEFLATMTPTKLHNLTKRFAEARINKSDPFAAARGNLYLRNGIINDVDVANIERKG